MSSDKLKHILEDLILDPKRHVEAFEVVSAVSTWPCTQDKQALLSDLLEGAGCTDCATCRARAVMFPEIRAKWAKLAVNRWNAMLTFGRPIPCQLEGCKLLASREFTIKNGAGSIRVCDPCSKKRAEIAKIALARIKLLETA